jgi:hypothetical protein
MGRDTRATLAASARSWFHSTLVSGSAQDVNLLASDYQKPLPDSDPSQRFCYSRGDAALEHQVTADRESLRCACPLGCHDHASAG